VVFFSGEGQSIEKAKGSPTRSEIELKEKDKMDAWWWSSVPYTVVFLLLIVVFRLEAYGHPLALFIYVAFLTTASSIFWLLVTSLPVRYRTAWH
jgi:hypothetical protein